MSLSRTSGTALTAAGCCLAGTCTFGRRFLALLDRPCRMPMLPGRCPGIPPLPLPHESSRSSKYSSANDMTTTDPAVTGGGGRLSYGRVIARGSVRIVSNVRPNVYSHRPNDVLSLKKTNYIIPIVRCIQQLNSRLLLDVEVVDRHLPSR